MIKPVERLVSTKIMAKEAIELLASGDYNFLTQECHGRGTKISVDAGDVLSGQDGYHHACWNQDEHERASGGAYLYHQLSVDSSQNLGP